MSPHIYIFRFFFMFLNVLFIYLYKDHSWQFDALNIILDFPLECLGPQELQLSCGISWVYGVMMNVEFNRIAKHVHRLILVLELDGLMLEITCFYTINNKKSKQKCLKKIWIFGKTIKAYWVWFWETFSEKKWVIVDACLTLLVPSVCSEVWSNLYYTFFFL